MRITITGKVVEIENTKENQFLHVCVAASDAYTRPNVFRVQNLGLQAKLDEIYEVDCEVTAFVMRRPYRDKQTGEPRQMTEPKVLLQVADLRPVQRTAPQPLKSASQ